MYDVLFQYDRVDPTTWVYLSSLLMIGLFFKFNRLWSVRNLDLVLLILLAPGLVLAHFGMELQEEAVAELQRASNVELVDDESIPQDVPWPQTALPVEETTPPETEPDETNQTGSDDETSATIDEENEAENGTAGETGETTENAEQPPDQLEQGQKIELLGYVWLMLACGVWLIRLLMDSTMVRRPLLEPNLSSGGLAFIGCAMFLFLMANVVNATAADANVAGLVDASAANDADGTENDFNAHGPGYSLLYVIPTLTTQTLYHSNDRLPPEQQNMAEEVVAAKIMAILSQLAIVVGMVLIGYRHFNNVRMGLGAAMIYLMLPYTAMMTGHTDHSLPAALLLWAVFTYRRPLVAGVLLGLAAGVVYYPFFLLPLWISFYWKRGLGRFLAGVGLALGAMVLSLLVSPRGDFTFVETLRQMFGVWSPVTEGLLGLWNDQAGGLDPNYRLPVLAAFVVLSISFALWPAQKNLGTLLSCSAALMVASQFWHGYGGGTFLAWFLPLAILTVFRPNLEDRVALSVLSETWLARRRTQVRALGGDAERAA